MKKTINKKEAEEKIKKFFLKKDFSRDEMRKIKRISMKYRISLNPYKTIFCKKCLSSLKNGKIRITKNHKVCECINCNYKNKTRIF